VRKNAESTNNQNIKAVLLFLRLYLIFLVGLIIYKFLTQIH